MKNDFFKNVAIPNSKLNQIMGGKYTFEHTDTNCKLGSRSRTVTVWDCGHVDYGPWAYAEN